MYNNATRCWSLQDAGGSYSWIVENYDSKDFQTMTDDEIHAWVDQLIDQERDEDARQIESWAENKHYPCFGYTTATILENADEYITYFKADFESDMVGEREYVFNWIKTWIKGKDNKMITSRWQDFFSERPCERGFARFSEAIEKYGLEAAVTGAPVSDRKWGGGTHLPSGHPFDLGAGRRYRSTLLRRAERPHTRRNAKCAGAGRSSLRAPVRRAERPHARRSAGDAVAG